MPGCYAVFHKQLGDLTLLEPALARLHAHHGGPVRLMTRRGHFPLVELMNGVEVQQGLATQPSAHLYCFDPLSKSAARSLFAPARKRHLIVPERRELRWFHPFVFPPVRNPEIGSTYVAEFFWRNTPVEENGPFRPPRLKTPPDSWAPAGVSPGSYLLLNPTAGWPMKMWTSQGWAELLHSIEEFGPFFLTHGGQDWQAAHCAEIASKTEGLTRIVSTSLREFLWLCAHARAVLTVDGSASHLASAFDVPSLTLFGPTSTAHWHHPGPGRAMVRAPADKDGVHRLRKMPADPAIAAARKLLSER